MSITFGEYLDMVEAEMSFRDRRQGQNAFNVLHRVNPELADAVRGTRLDPFYQDDRLDDFYSHIDRHWDKP